MNDTTAIRHIGQPLRRRVLLQPIPQRTLHVAEQLVHAALQALDQGELVCFPSLENASLWTGFEHARVDLSRALMQSGKPATRYSEKAR